MVENDMAVALSLSDEEEEPPAPVDDKDDSVSKYERRRKTMHPPFISPTASLPPPLQLGPPKEGESIITSSVHFIAAPPEATDTDEDERGH